MELIKTLLEQQPLMALFLTIAIGYLVGEINVKGFSLGVGAVLFVALATGWSRRSRCRRRWSERWARALPLRRGRAIRNAVLHRANEPRRSLGEHDRADRRAGSRCGEPRPHEDDGPQTRARVGIVRWFGSQHGGAAGGGRGARQRRSRSRLLGRLPVRRGRADPVPLHRLHLVKAEDPSAHGHRPGASRNRRAQSGTVRQVAQRVDDRIARRGADRRAAPGGPRRAGFAQLRHRRK